MLKKWIKHIKKWNAWRKHSLNSPISKLLVLFRVISTPTFEHFWSEEDARQFREGFLQGLREAADDKEGQEAHWIHCPETPRFKEHWSCSRCKHDICENPKFKNWYTGESLDFKWCPICGAKMSGEVSDV